MRRANHAPLYLAVAFLVAAVALGFVPVMHHLGSSYLSYRNSPFPVVSPVHAGQASVTTVSRCNSADHDVKYTFARNLVNDQTGNQIVLAAGASIVPVGCHTILSWGTVVPPGTPPGRYHLEAATTAPGLWGDYDIPWSTQSFDVVP